MSATHVHLILNHVPVVGTFFGLGLLAAGLMRQSEDLKRAGLLGFVFAAVVTLPVLTSGVPAERAVQGLPGIEGGLIEQHREIGQLASSATLALGGLGASALLLFRRGAAVPGWFSALVLAAGLVAQGLTVWAAHSGGLVRHTEIRPPPASER